MELTQTKICQRILKDIQQIVSFAIFISENSPFLEKVLLLTILDFFVF